MAHTNNRAAIHRSERARERAMLYEKRKKRRKRIFYGFLTFLGLALLTAFIVLKVFVVKKVEVTGNKYYSNEKMKNWILNDEYSDNSLYVYFKYRFFEPEELPFVDTMEISLIPPSTIQINVIEKGILGYLYLEQIGQNVYFDKEGFVVETSPESIEDVPRITGIDVEKIVLYEKLPIKEEKVLKDLLSLTQTLKKYEVVPISIEYRAGEGYKMEYGEITVSLGQAEKLNDKILRLAQIMPKLEGQSGVLKLETISDYSSEIVFEKNDDN